ncbi:MAG: bifunctional fucokinase/L-fucose-1-P-guanylyltransferase [Clostridia bacterium]|nr:bifunctional fucokinase/L-fucose-1-P-guanylyltransferase [Clostridia bacterium]
MISLFLQQSLQDREADFVRSLNDPDCPHFDLIVLTASDEHQAEGFRAQLRQRKLPRGTEFAVIPDRGGQRVGSGGATLSAIRYVKEKLGGFSGRRVAVIHSGGDGKRTPNYSALGKVFSPVPRLLPDGHPSTLFDEFLLILAGMAGRIREGMLLFSGDVLLLFNQLQFDFSGHGAAAISFKENVATAVNHGVFLPGANGNVSRFLHKQGADTLRSCGAVNAHGNVSIDTGAVVFAPDLLEALYALVDSEDGADRYINSRVRLSLYGDFLYPLAEDATLEDYYREAPEGEWNDALRDARTVLWQTLRPFRLQLQTFSPAKFIHFGTTAEVMALMNGGWREYAAQGWSHQVRSCAGASTAAYGSVVSHGAQVGAGVYLEYTYVHHNAKVGKHCLLSFVDIHEETIPDDVALHCVKQLDGKFVCRIYGTGDNPKQDKLFGMPLAELGISADSLWEAELYPVCDTVREAVEATLNLYRIAVGNGGDVQAWQAARRVSMRSGFNNADPQALIDWQRRMTDLVAMFELESRIDDGEAAPEPVSRDTARVLSDIQKKWLTDRVASLDLNETADFGKAIRLYRYLASALGGEAYQKKWFSLISETVQKHTIEKLSVDRSLRIAVDRTTVRLPLRVNWGGGWTDTPPYCIENGGTVLNCAILLDGEFPVRASFEKIGERKIVLASGDLNAYGEFDDIAALQRFGDPSDVFALQKACLVACGLIPKTGGKLDEILAGIGGGFVMWSEVVNVPKGSGLGTSSILSAACVKAFLAFFGKPCAEEMLYDYVLAMEQLMSTGGGWQDQVGGLTPGIKYITSKPGVEQHVTVEHLELDAQTKRELQERFCLIYTGQRRLARNLLRDVVSRYVGNEPGSIQAHKKIKEIAAQMRAALCCGNIDEFSDLLNQHLEQSMIINPETVNTLINYIFFTVDDLVAGRFVCGAGGGGFLQVILKKGVTKEAVRQRLQSAFQDFPVDVWDCELLFL